MELDKKLEQIIINAVHLDTKHKKKSKKGMCLLQVIEQNIEKVGRKHNKKRKHQQTPDQAAQSVTNILGSHPLMQAPPVGNDSDSSDDDDGGIGGYNPGAFKRKLMEMIQNLVLKIKKAIKHGGARDFFNEISMILGQMTDFGQQQVGASSVIMKVGTDRKAGLANMNRLAADKDGSKVNDVNPYTGKQEPAKLVSPEKALADQIAFLVNNPMSKYKLDSKGKSTGEKNPSYVFFHNVNNYQSYVNQVTTFNDLISHLQGPNSKGHPSIPLPKGFPPASFEDLEKFALPPISVSNLYGKKSNWNLQTGSIAYINYLANPNGDQYNPSKTPGLVSEAFKKAYITIFGRQAFNNLRIPPGTKNLDKFLHANASDPKAFNEALKKLNAAQAGLKKARADSDAYGKLAQGCRDHLGTCTMAQYNNYVNKYNQAQSNITAFTGKISSYTSDVEHDLMGSSKGHGELDTFFKQIQNGTSPVSDKGIPKTPDSSALNAVTTALTELSGQNDTVTNTMSTFLKQQIQNYQAAQTMEKNTLQDVNTMVKASVQGQRTN